MNIDDQTSQQSSRSLMTTRSSPGALSTAPYTPSTASTSSDSSLKRDREREGRCSECGVQTHEFCPDPHTGRPKKVPLTVEDEVHRGRCLLCHPLKRPIGMHGGGSSGRSSRRHRHHHHTISDCDASVRSLNTVSTQGTHGSHGTMSVRSEPASVGTFSIHPSTVESVSVLTQSMASVDVAVIQEALASFDAESADLCDIIGIMRQYPTEQKIQEKGCEKLWIQSWDDDNSVAIGRVGGIPTILDAMRNYGRRQHLQHCGCEALQNLALNEFNRVVIIQNGGIGVIVRAMTKHWTVSGVQQCGCTALANLAADNFDRKKCVAEGGGIQAIVKAADNFTHDETVMRAAYQALRVMGYDPAQHPLEGQRQQLQQQSPQSIQQQQLPTNQQEGPPSEQQQQQGETLTLDKYGFPLRR